MALPLVINPGDVGHLTHHQRLHSLAQFADASSFNITGYKRDIAANRPAAVAGNIGMIYDASDTSVVTYSTGSAWVTLITATGSQTWTGIQTFSGDAYFASGRPWVSFRAKGAAGDGTTDDTTAISNCFTAANTFASGSRPAVYAEAGQYKTTTSVQTFGIDLIGLTSPLQKDCTIVWTGTGDCLKVDSTRTVGMRIEQIRIDGSGAAANWTGVHFAFGMVASYILNCEIRCGTLATHVSCLYGLYYDGTQASANNTLNQVINCVFDYPQTGVRFGDDVANGMGSNSVVLGGECLGASTACFYFTGGQNTIMGGDHSSSGTGSVLYLNGSFCQNNGIIGVEFGTQPDSATAWNITIGSSCPIGPPIFTRLYWRTTGSQGDIHDLTADTSRKWVDFSNGSRGGLVVPFLEIDTNRVGTPAAVTQIFFGSATVNPGTIANGASTNFNVACTGARQGDLCLASHVNIANSGVLIVGVCNQNDVVNVIILNLNGSPITVGSGIARVFAFRNLT